MNDKKTSLEETTKVADYFKQHEGLFVATVSATITAITIIISFLAYVYQNIILQEYKVPLDIINTLNHGHLFYYVLMSMAIFAVNPLIQNRLMSIFLQHYRKVAINKLFRIQLCDDVDEKTKENFNHNLDVARKGNLRNFLHSIITVFFLFLVAYAIHTIAAGSFGITMLVNCVVIGMINLLFGRAQAKKHAGEYGPKKIGKLVDEIESEPEQEKRKTKWLQHFESLRKDILDETYRKKYTSDGKVIEYTVSIVLSVVAVTVFVVISAYAEAKTQHSFWIYQDADKQYAIVYQNPEVFVLEEAIIRDDELTIVLNQQRYLKFEDVEVKKREFRHVKKVDELIPIDTLNIEGEEMVC